MFWRRNKSDPNQPAGSNVSFDEAKEATRRAAFLNVAQGMTADEVYRQQLSELLETCRSVALATGASVGHSAAEIDATIGALCDADTARLRHVSDEEFQAFVRESGEIVNRFLSKM